MPQLNAWATWLTCQWLMGECEVNDVEIDGGGIGQGHGVLIKRCVSGAGMGAAPGRGTAWLGQRVGAAQPCARLPACRPACLPGSLPACLCHKGASPPLLNRPPPIRPPPCRRCRYLEEAGCASVCLNSCKAPTQAFFSRHMGLPLDMRPNYEDYSCQFRWAPPLVPPALR